MLKIDCNKQLPEEGQRSFLYPVTGQPAEVFYNGENVGAFYKCLTEDNHFIFPARDIFKALRVDAAWDSQNSRTVKVRFNNNVKVLPLRLRYGTSWITEDDLATAVESIIRRTGNIYNIVNLSIETIDLMTEFKIFNYEEEKDWLARYQDKNRWIKKKEKNNLDVNIIKANYVKFLKDIQEMRKNVNIFSALQRVNFWVCHSIGYDDFTISGFYRSNEIHLIVFDNSTAEILTNHLIHELGHVFQDEASRIYQDVENYRKFRGIPESWHRGCYTYEEGIKWGKVLSEVFSEDFKQAFSPYCTKNNTDMDKLSDEQIAMFIKLYIL